MLVNNKEIDSCCECEYFRTALTPEIIGCVLIHKAGVNIHEKIWDMSDLYYTGEAKFLLGCPFKK